LFFTKEIIIHIAFSHLYARWASSGMIMCLGCTNDVSIITTSVVVLIVDHTRVVTIGCAIDELDPSIPIPLINTMPKTITRAQIF
jgi:hypothetical protein